jgi:hypothetical protein
MIYQVVLSILSNFSITNNWGEAFEKTIPARKGAILKGKEESESEEDVPTNEIVIPNKETE